MDERIYDDHSNAPAVLDMTPASSSLGRGGGGGERNYHSSTYYNLFGEGGGRGQDRRIAVSIKMGNQHCGCVTLPKVPIADGGLLSSPDWNVMS